MSDTINVLLFIACGISYLVWYYRISCNYDHLTGNRSASKNLMFWFIPILNSFLVTKQLKRVYQTYLDKSTNKEEAVIIQTYNRVLYFWLTFFVIMYLFLFYIEYNSSSFYEDNEIFLAMNPKVHLFRQLFGILLDLTGLTSMIFVIKSLMNIEESILDSNKDWDIMDHLVIDKTKI